MCIRDRPVPGAAVLELDGPLRIPAIPVDVMVVVVFELLHMGSPGSPARVVAWGALTPFQKAPANSYQGAIRPREGNAEVELRSGPGKWVRDQPVLAWKSANGSSPKVMVDLHVGVPEGTNEKPRELHPVSYTHLTLPTIYSV